MTAGIRIWKETAGETETKQMIPDKLLQEENRVSGEEKRNPSGSPTDSTRKERCGTKRREGTERQEGTEQQDGTWKPESLRQHPAQGAGERSTDRDLQESQELARDFDPAGQDSHPRLVLAVGTAPNKNLRRSAIASIQGNPPVPLSVRGLRKAHSGGTVHGNPCHHQQQESDAGGGGKRSTLCGSPGCARNPWRCPSPP